MAKDPRKTEPATPKRRQKARDEGQVARSIELTNSAIFLAIVINAIFFSQYLYRHLFDIFRWGFGDLLNTHITQQNIYSLIIFVMEQFLLTILPWLGVILFVGLAINIYQVGWKVTTKPLAPKLSKLNPLNGVKRLFSMQALLNLLKSVAKVVVVGLVLYYALKDETNNLINLMDQSVGSILLYISKISYKIILKILFILVPIGILDFLYQKHDYEENMKMTKEEVKDERRQAEGDPQVKSKIRSKQFEIIRRRMLQEVPKADVIITNPTHIAVALKYERNEMDAPMVIAKGAGLIAERIKKIASENSVPIVENKPLARTIFKTVELGEYIPEELYKAVAEILAYVYRLKNKLA
jgi:flagellar biosynthetic protein FlhB